VIAFGALLQTQRFNGNIVIQSIKLIEILLKKLKKRKRRKKRRKKIQAVKKKSKEEVWTMLVLNTIQKKDFYAKTGHLKLLISMVFCQRLFLILIWSPTSVEILIMSQNHGAIQWIQTIDGHSVMKLKKVKLKVYGDPKDQVIEESKILP